MGETNGIIPISQMRKWRPQHVTSPLSAHTGWAAADVGFNPLETLFFPLCLPVSQLRL